MPVLEASAIYLMQHSVHKAVSSYTKIDSPCTARFAGFLPLYQRPRHCCYYLPSATQRSFFSGSRRSPGTLSLAVPTFTRSCPATFVSLGSDKDGDDEPLSKIYRAVDQRPPLCQRRLPILPFSRPRHSSIHCWAATEPPKPPG